MGVAMYREWKVGEGANLGPIGGDQLHSSANTATGVSARYKDHWNVIKFDIMDYGSLINFTWFSTSSSSGGGNCGCGSCGCGYNEFK